jgi:SAUR family protein
MLREPCMEGLLEMAAQQFGYGQQGVLRIPCDARQFHQMMVSVHGKSRS